MKTLARIVEFFGRLLWTKAFALAFIEHGELARDFIIGGDGYFAGRSREDRLIFTKDQHATPPVLKLSNRHAIQEGPCCQINYGANIKASAITISWILL